MNADKGDAMHDNRSKSLEDLYRLRDSERAYIKEFQGLCVAQDLVEESRQNLSDIEYWIGIREAQRDGKE